MPKPVCLNFWLIWTSFERCGLAITCSTIGKSMAFVESHIDDGAENSREVERCAMLKSKCVCDIVPECLISVDASFQSMHHVCEVSSRTSPLASLS